MPRTNRQIIHLNFVCGKQYALCPMVLCVYRWLVYQENKHHRNSNKNKNRNRKMIHPGWLSNLSGWLVSMMYYVSCEEWWVSTQQSLAPAALLISKFCWQYVNILPTILHKIKRVVWFCDSCGQRNNTCTFRRPSVMYCSIIPARLQYVYFVLWRVGELYQREVSIVQCFRTRLMSCWPYLIRKAWDTIVSYIILKKFMIYPDV